jgi:hypothetical protein
VNLAIEGDIKLKVFFQLLDQASFDQSDRCRVNTRLWLL